MFSRRTALAVPTTTACSEALWHGISIPRTHSTQVQHCTLHQHTPSLGRVGAHPAQTFRRGLQQRVAMDPPLHVHYPQQRHRKHGWSMLARQGLPSRSHFNHHPAECLTASSCSGWTNRGLMGLIMYVGHYAKNPFWNGGGYNSGWRWTHPYVCKSMCTLLPLFHMFIYPVRSGCR